LTKRLAGIALLAAAGLALAATAIAATASRPASSSKASAASVTPAQLRACRTKSIGVAAPMTGPAAFLGQEQLSWVRFAVAQYN
jgi:ABC-type branched-subunit amino acid transport system substrate-binding protein